MHVGCQAAERGAAEFMNAIEFDALPEQRSIHLPEEAPDGVRLRVVLLWEQPGAKEDDLKTLFASTTEHHRAPLRG
jgi:hypothetical protein